MAWLYLFLAGFFEIVWAAGLHQTAGFTRLWPSVMTVSAMAISFGFLGLALRTLPLGTAYAIWTSIGIVGTTLFGAAVLGENLDAPRLVCLAAIAGGVAGLKMLSGS